MLALIDRNELAKALGHVAGVPPVKTDVPILSCLLLTVGADGGTLRGTDDAIEVSCPFKVVKTSEAGRIMVPAKLLHDCVKRIPEGKELTLTTTTDKGGAEVLRLVAGRSKFDLWTVSADDYPLIVPRPQGRFRRFELEARQLRGLLAGVKHAMAKDESRFYLGGVYFHVTEANTPELRAVATTGHVLGLQACLAPTGAIGMAGVIIPRDTVSELLKHLPDGELLVEVQVGERSIWFNCPGDLVIGSKLLEGTYPEYQRVIPENSNYFTADADALASVIERVASVCHAGSKGVVLAVQPVKREAVVRAKGAGHGSAEDVLELGEVRGKVSLGLNPAYILAALAVYKGATVEVRYGLPAAPVVILLAGDTSETSLQVVMPMRHDETLAADLEPQEQAA